jgi:hypothetical protein
MDAGVNPNRRFPEGDNQPDPTLPPSHLPVPSLREIPFLILVSPYLVKTSSTQAGAVPAGRRPHFALLIIPSPFRLRGVSANAVGHPMRVSGSLFHSRRGFRLRRPCYPLPGAPDADRIVPQNRVLPSPSSIPAVSLAIPSGLWVVPVPSPVFVVT